MLPDVPQAQSPTPDAALLTADDWPAHTLLPLSSPRLPQYQAVVRRSVIEAIHVHGRSDTTVEVCGVLVGNVYRDELGPYLHVASSIQGDRADGHAAQVTFTAATWAAIQEIMDRDHPDERIVGWYHTHPGFGIFLSGMDLFIQDHFFNLPWQVAFVYDPIGGDEGMFFWREGKTDRQPFLIEEDPAKEIVPPESPAPAVVGAVAVVEAPKAPTEVVQEPPPADPVPAPAEYEPESRGPSVAQPTDPDKNPWAFSRAVHESRSSGGIPVWLIAALTFVISFGGTLVVMYLMTSNDVLIVPHHTDHPGNQPTTQSPVLHSAVDGPSPGNRGSTIAFGPIKNTGSTHAG